MTREEAQKTLDELQVQHAAHTAAVTAGTPTPGLDWGRLISVLKFILDALATVKKP